MNTHNYLTRIKDEHWEDIQRVRTLDNRSANSIINEGIRLVIKEKLQELSTLRKNRWKGNTGYSFFRDLKESLTSSNQTKLNNLKRSVLV